MAKTIGWIFVLLLTLAAAFSASFFSHDPGYLQLRLGDNILETTIPVLIGSLVVLYLALRLFFYLVRFPFRVRRDYKDFRHARMSRKGYLALQEGDWRDAEKQLLKLAHDSGQSDHYLAAARAAHEQKAGDRRNQYLALARDSGKDRFSVDLARAEWLIDEGDTGKAQTLLESLRRKKPGHPRVLELLLKLYELDRNWTAIRKMANRLKRKGIVDEPGLEELEIRLLVASIRAADNPESLKQAWRSLNRKQRHARRLIEAYVHRASQLDCTSEVEQMVEKRLKRDWDIQLVHAYGLLKGGDQVSRIHKAEKWLADHPENPVLLQSLGRMCLGAKLYGQARQYLESALARLQTSASYELLGRVAEAWQAPEVALACYRNALALEHREAVEALPQWPELNHDSDSTGYQLDDRSQTGLPKKPLLESDFI